MPIRAEVRLTIRGLRLLAKLSDGPAHTRAVAQAAINSTLKRGKPKAVRAIRARRRSRVSSLTRWTSDGPTRAGNRPLPTIVELLAELPQPPA